MRSWPVIPQWTCWYALSCLLLAPGALCGARGCVVLYAPRALTPPRVPPLFPCPQVVSQGIATMQGYTPTTEGVDVKLSLHYYSRMGFITSLLPALRRSTNPRVLSVLSAGMHKGSKELLTDLGLAHSYSLANAANAAGFYNDLGLDALARAPGNERIKFVHAVRPFSVCVFVVVGRGLVGCPYQ